MIVRGHNYRLWRLLVFAAPTFVTFVIGSLVQGLPQS
nr:MAG TPA: hypothetical protein [Caudoviricetes sp.]